MSCYFCKIKMPSVPLQKKKYHKYPYRDWNYPHPWSLELCLQLHIYWGRGGGGQVGIITLNPLQVKYEISSLLFFNIILLSLWLFNLIRGICFQQSYRREARMVFWSASPTLCCVCLLYTWFMCFLVILWS